MHDSRKMETQSHMAEQVLECGRNLMIEMAYAEIELEQQDLSITPLNKMKNNLLGYNNPTLIQSMLTVGDGKRNCVNF